MLNRHYRLALLACSATIALSATSKGFAQNATASQPAETETTVAAKEGETYLSTIVIKGGRDADPYAKPGPSSVVSMDEINLQAGQETDDLLRGVPGTSTANNPQNPGVAVNVRGFEGSGRVNMMIDGVRQNFRFTGHEAQGFAYIDPAFLSEIDLTRGAVTGVGGGALAGSVNFRTYDVEDLIQDGKNYGGQAAITYGSNGTGLSESLLGAYRFNDAVSVLGGISKSDPGNYDNGDGIEVPFTEEDLLSGLLKAEITPDKDHSFKFSAMSYDNDFFANSYFQNVTNQTIGANYAYTPDNDLIDFRANAYYNRVRMKYDGNISGAGAAQGRRITDTGTGFDVSNTSVFDLGEVAVRSSYGVEYFQDDYDVINSAAQPSGGVNGSGKNSTAGIFKTTTFTYGIVDLTAGLRYDRFTLDGSGSVVAGNPLGLPAGTYNVDRSDGRLNPSITLAINATEWLQPYLTYAESSRSPTINETFVGGTHPGAIPQSFFPNPFLDPEISRGWEVGANLNLDGILDAGDSFRLKANYFHTRVDNYITGAMQMSIFGPRIFFVNNPGTSTVQGFELQAAYDAGYVFGNLAYTHTDSELPSQINGFGVQSFLPDDIFSATVGGRFLEDQRLTVGTRFYAVSAAFIGDVNVSPPASAFVNGYGLVDLFANYKFENGLELTGSVTNLFDKAYTPASSTIAGNTVDTGRGRTFLVTAKAKF
ncbi:hemoglobin/transferrin/lactoferrin receptor protein [Sinorhizobium kostiense]|uniref:Hemoglobin/transferrin/lactoferrin receptor protein n=1 Tax=Sinorhizobium kostiense TaxID=76747 RepID=A0ABS4QSU5_9HYPH|nr:TonB-dependent receptor [Sinorhizobium kostiense]MBP2233722.1 hemoglobin/transferrin/lactoferrin receptor protein [Sinorhizobium kostiense]